MTSFYEEIQKLDKMSDEKEDIQSRASVDKWIFRLLLLLAGVTPLIVLANAQEVISPLISNVDALLTGIKGDLFTYYKSLFVIVITLIMSTLLVFKIFIVNGEIRRTPVNYLIGLFMLAIIFSTALSDNIAISLMGQYNRSDGAISWLCYLTILFIAMNISYPKNAIKYIMYALLPFVFINLYITTMSFYGKDLLQNKGVQKIISLVLPNEAIISDNSTLVGTLNQWNYMSGMFAMIIAMYLAWVFIEKSWKQSIIGLIAALASVVVLLMSISTSGFLTTIVCLILLVILIFKVKDKKKALLLLIIFISVSTLALHMLAKKDSRVWDESVGFFFNNPYSNEETTSDIQVIDRYSYFNLVNKTYASDNSFALPILPERATSFGSGRGYIWGETFKLIKEKPVLGYGLDSLLYNFPHYQLESRKGMYSETMLVDKPHNLFIGIFYGTGIVGFIALLALAILQTGLFAKVLFVKPDNLMSIVVGIGVIAYFIQSMFNDSLPGVTTLAFILMGIMIAIVSNNSLERR